MRSACVSVPVFKACSFSSSGATCFSPFPAQGCDLDPPAPVSLKQTKHVRAAPAFPPIVSGALFPRSAGFSFLGQCQGTAKCHLSLVPSGLSYHLSRGPYVGACPTVHLHVQTLGSQGPGPSCSSSAKPSPCAASPVPLLSVPSRPMMVQQAPQA